MFNTLDKETTCVHTHPSLSFHSSLGALDVRLGCDLCGAEQDFLHKRKNVVAAALKKVLQLDQELQGHEVWWVLSCNRTWMGEEEYFEVLVY